MKRRVWTIAGTALVFASQAAMTAAKDTGAAAPFAVAKVRFEQNATDKDVEVVFEVNGGDEGLAKLAVVAPDGRTVVDFTAPDASVLGIRQFVFESPEPTDVARLKSVYPQGVYTFTGTTAGGRTLHSEAKLSHDLPPPVSFVKPGVDAEDVAVKNVTIAWTPTRNATAYIVAIEQEELDLNVTTRLPGSATQFAVPDGFLVPGTEYHLGIGTVAADGNSSFVETSFTTAGKN
jgi:hypothetical protein